MTLSFRQAKNILNRRWNTMRLSLAVEDWDNSKESKDYCDYRDNVFEEIRNLENKKDARRLAFYTALHPEIKDIDEDVYIMEYDDEIEIYFAVLDYTLEFQHRIEALEKKFEDFADINPIFVITSREGIKFEYVVPAAAFPMNLEKNKEWWKNREQKNNRSNHV